MHCLLMVMHFVSGSTDCGNKGRLASRFAAADASPKPFDLVHPTKGEDIDFVMLT